MWTASGDKYSESWTYKGHGDEVLGLSMHPSGKGYIAITSRLQLGIFFISESRIDYSWQCCLCCSLRQLPGLRCERWLALLGRARRSLPAGRQHSCRRRRRPVHLCRLPPRRSDPGHGLHRGLPAHLGRAHNGEPAHAGRPWRRHDLPGLLRERLPGGEWRRGWVRPSVGP